MINFSAHAVRQGKTVEVTVSGILPNSCTKIVITDFYPGNRIYVRDPGHAQLFLEVVTNIESGICIMNTIPFSITKHLYDETHTDVEVNIEGNGQLTIPIIDISNQFIVVNMIGGFVPPPSYSIVPDSFKVDGIIFEKSYGPATYEQCKEWIKGKSFKQNPQTLFLSGSNGSGAPRG